MWRDPLEMRQFMLTLLIITIQYTLLKHHFKSSPGDFPPGESSHTTPVDSSSGTLPPGTLPRETCPINPPPGTRKSPRFCETRFVFAKNMTPNPNCLPRFRETPYDTRGLPCFSSSVPCHFYYPERAGIPK